MQEAYKDVGSWISDGQLPIVYNAAYNIKFLGIEKLHPFDSTKFQKVKAGLEKEGLVKSSQASNLQPIYIGSGANVMIFASLLVMY